MLSSRIEYALDRLEPLQLALFFPGLKDVVAPQHHQPLQAIVPSNGSNVDRPSDGLQISSPERKMLGGARNIDA
jgi:hypothetical protein